MLGVVIKMLLGLKRDNAVLRTILRASLLPPTDPPPLTVLETEAEKAQRRHGLHVVHGGPVAVLAALAWRMRRHMWRTAGISSAAVGVGTLMVAVFAIGAPPSPPRAPIGGQLPVVGATEPVAAPTAAVPAPSPSATGPASNSPPNDGGAQTVVVVAAARSSTVPALIPKSPVSVPIPTLSTVKAPDVVASSSSTCAVSATVAVLLGVCVL